QYNLMMSLVSSKKFDNNILSYDSMIRYINEMFKCKYREDAYDLLSKITEQTLDPVQIRTFTRIANSKNSKPQCITLKELRCNKADVLVVKKCPHCGHECTALRNTTYMICGY